MLTRGRYYELLSEVELLRRQLAEDRITERGDDVALRNSLSNIVQSLRVLAAEGDDGRPSPDGGIAALAGVGPDAANGLDHGRVAPTIAAYDDAVTSERILAISDLYYVYQHERIGMFRAILKLQELFRAGSVRLSDGPGALSLYQYDRRRVLRYTQRERWQAYRRVFGYTDATPPRGSRPNGSFHKLFTNFAVRVARFFRDQRISEVIRPDGREATFGSVAVVRRAGLDLRGNLKQASYGHVNVMVIELSQLLESAFNILGSPDVMNLFGADSAWDVLEEVMRRYLNQPISASQRNRMGSTGRDMLRWLAFGHVLESDTRYFEELLVDVAASAEEWLTSAESVGLMRSEPSSGAKVIPLRTAREALL